MATKTLWQKHEATFTCNGEKRIRKASKANGAPIDFDKVARAYYDNAQPKQHRQLDDQQQNAWLDTLDAMATRRAEHRRAIHPTLKLQIDDTARALSSRLGIAAKPLCQTLAYWVARVPEAERVDWLQTMAVKLLESKPATNALAFVVAKCDTMSWWRAFKLRQHFSLDTARESDDDNAKTMLDSLCAVAQYEAMIESDDNARALWRALAPNIQAIVSKRLNGARLSCAERQTLCRYLHKAPLTKYTC